MFTFSLILALTSPRLALPDSDGWQPGNPIT